MGNKIYQGLMVRETAEKQLEMNIEELSTEIMFKEEML